jgi:hypothetical protein
MKKHIEVKNVLFFGFTALFWGLLLAAVCILVSCGGGGTLEGAWAWTMELGDHQKETNELVFFPGNDCLLGRDYGEGIMRYGFPGTYSLIGDTETISWTYG